MKSRLVIKELAEAQGLDAAKLARRADLSQRTMHLIWNNPYSNPTLRTMEKIADVLGVGIGDLRVDDEQSE